MTVTSLGPRHGTIYTLNFSHDRNRQLPRTKRFQLRVQGKHPRHADAGYETNRPASGERRATPNHWQQKPYHHRRHRARVPTCSVHFRFRCSTSAFYCTMFTSQLVRQHTKLRWRNGEHCSNPHRKPHLTDGRRVADLAAVSANAPREKFRRMQKNWDIKYKFNPANLSIGMF